jgi:peptide/nickel transport system substrate-binding protein
MVASVLAVLVVGEAVAQEAQAENGGTLVIALASNPPGLLEPELRRSRIWWPDRSFNSLVAYDYDLNMQPELARSWAVSPDNLTVTFSLEPNVRRVDDARR